MNNINSKNILLSAQKYWPCLLILLAFIGFVSKSLYNYPIGIMALLGLYNTISSPRKIFQDRVLKHFMLVYICLWLPLLISFPDAVNPEHSAHTVFPYLRFFFAGLFIITELSKDNDRIKFILDSLFFLVLFWCIDATIQFVFHKNIFGFPYKAGHITGMFYPRNTISHICSILSAFSFLYAYKHFENKKYLILSIIPLFFIVLLSGRRSAWIMLALSSFSFIIYGFIYSKNKKNYIKTCGIIISLVSVLLASTIAFHPPTNKRFKTTLGLFSNNYELVNKATATRLPLWETSITIIKENPINGIGPRGFRHVYEDYAKKDDFFVKKNKIPTQPHILILEVLAETGLIGFLGYLIALYLILNLAKQSNKKKAMFPFLIPVLVALFPFNAHMAFYGSIWSSMTWLLLALYFSRERLTLNS